MPNDADARERLDGRVRELLPATVAVRRDGLEWMFGLDPSYEPRWAGAQLALLASVRDRYVEVRAEAWLRYAIRCLREGDVEVMGRPAWFALVGLVPQLAVRTFPELPSSEVFDAVGWVAKHGEEEVRAALLVI